ncbi:MAG: hypothetical protein MUC92_04710 [Fimbriimonadaceae bacterium]|jgi:hypothetical protein|nr:hypothetical protein [Fimbriimonadaceae bacterium]
MKKLPCPHCQSAEIPYFTKLTLGPGRTISCPKCGGAISVPWTSLLLLVVFFGSVGIASQTGIMAVKVAVWVVGAILMALIVQFMIPLQARTDHVGKR